jgi:hypothetical protein
MDLNWKSVKDRIEKHYNKSRILTIGRTANLTVPHKGRGSCQYRDLCSRGCPFGAYFSTQSSTLPAATKDWRLDPIPLLITSFMIKTQKKQKELWLSMRRLMKVSSFMPKLFCKRIYARIKLYFIEFNLKHILTIRNASGQLGHNLMDHHFVVALQVVLRVLKINTYVRRANGIYVPRYQNVGNDKETI